MGDMMLHAIRDAILGSTDEEFANEMSLSWLSVSWDRSLFIQNFTFENSCSQESVLPNMAITRSAWVNNIGTWARGSWL